MLPAFLTNQFMTGLVREFPQQSLTGDAILPFRSIASMEAVWDTILRDAKLAPFVAINAESPLAEKPDYSRVIQTLAVVREKEMLNEDDLIALRAPGSPDMVDGLTANTAAVAAQAIRDTSNRMARRVMQRVEWMRWAALTGTIAYDDNKVVFSLTTGVTAAHSTSLARTSTSAWSDTSSTPLNDIATWQELMLEDTGRVASTMYVGLDVPQWLMQNAAIRALFVGNDRMAALLNTNTVLDFIGSITGLKIIRNYTSYQTAAGTQTFFLGRDKIVMVPDPVQSDGERLGSTLTGPAKANNYQTGLYGWVKEEEDPWATFCGAGIHAFPALEHPEWVIYVDVDDDQ
jgi:hypothetical protein